MSTSGTESYSDSRADWNGQQWQDQWDQDWQHLDSLMSASKNDPHDHDGSFMAIAYIASVLFLFVGDYNEDYKMGRQADVQNQLTEIDDRRNKIETDFDTLETTNSTGTYSTAQEKAARDALKQYYGYNETVNGKKVHVDGLEELLNNGQKEGLFDSSFVDSVTQEFIPTSDGADTGGGIFGSATEGNTSTDNASKLADYWYQQWNPVTDSNSTNGTPVSTDTSIEPTTDGLTAVSSDVSSQSSIVQSKLNVYESDDENYQSMTHSLMSNVIDSEKQSNTAIQSSS